MTTKGIVRIGSPVDALLDTWQIVCSGCETAKLEEQFRRSANGHYLNQCRACEVAYSKAWRERNLEHRRAYAREYMRELRWVDRDWVREYERDYAQERRDRLKVEATHEVKNPL